jgi:hypothetical protein
MPSPIAEDEKRIIEEAKGIIDAAPKGGPLDDPVAYAKALPQLAGPLARVLSSTEFVGAAARYHAADAAAGVAQTSFRRLGRTSSYCGSGAAVLGGVLLYLGSEASLEAWRANLGLAQFALLVVSLLCAFWLFTSKPYRTWRTERASAEAVRLRIFNVMVGRRVEAKGDEIPLLALQLECFRRHLVEDQRGFFAKRGPQHRRTVIAWKFVGAIAIVLVLGASLPQFLRLERFGLLPDMLRNLIAQVPLDQKGYVLAGLVGIAIQGLLAALAVISPAQRNASTYREMCKSLGTFLGAPLQDARKAAVRGDHASVQDFTQSVSEVLADEAKEWLLLQQVLSDMAPRVIPPATRTSP